MTSNFALPSASSAGVAESAKRDAAAVEYSTGLTIAAELRLLRGELAVASAWSSYCRAQGTHTPALKYGEAVIKLAGRLVALREIEAADKLDLMPKLLFAALLAAGLAGLSATLWATSVARSHDPISWERATEKNRNT